MGGGGHFLFVAPQSLEEAFVFTSLETWVSGGAWDRGSEWGPVPMGAASGACQQLATFPVSSTAWLGSLHDRGLRGIHVGVGFRICAVLARVQKIAQPVYYTLKDFLCVLCFGYPCEYLF